MLCFFIHNTLLPHHLIGSYGKYLLIEIKEYLTCHNSFLGHSIIINTTEYRQLV